MGRLFRRSSGLFLAIHLLAAFAATPLGEIAPTPAVSQEVGFVPGKETETRKGHLQRTILTTGRLRPLNVVHVSSELSGILEMIKVSENDTVSAGQLIATIDVADLEVKLREARLSLKLARSRMELAEHLADFSLKKLQRHEKLNLRGTITDSTIDELRSKFGELKFRHQIARDEFNIALNRIEELEIEIARGKIRSPIAGVVLSVEAEPGQNIVSSFEAPDLFLIAKSLDRMVMDISVDEIDIGEIRSGDSIVFQVQAYPNLTFESTIDAVSNWPVIEDGIVRYKAWVDVDNPDFLLKPGMTTYAQLTTTLAQNVVIIPEAALVRKAVSASGRDRKATVLVRVGEGIVEKRVTVLATYETDAAVDGLEEGEIVIVGGRNE